MFIHVAMYLGISLLLLATAVVSQDSGDTEKGSISDDTLRLIGGATRCSGQVQVNQKGEWFNICRTRWSEAEGQVVCRQLGCGDLVSPCANYKDKAPAYPVWSEIKSCTGDEATLMNCSSSSDEQCPDSYRVGIACQQPNLPNAPESMSVRLMNGTTNHSGRVEIYYNGEWGTVCGQNGWSITDGHVVCRQLGYSGAVAVKDHFDPFGAGTGTILMSLVDCDGHEDYLGNCSQQGWYQHNCEHRYDAGVICEVPSNGTSIRIVGVSRYEGRVEVYYNGEWGTICDDSWDIDDARVVCRQLGWGPALSAGQHYGEGKGAILLSDMQCDGSETTITDCEKSEWYPSSHCQHREDAGVQCAIPEEPDVHVRLSQDLLDSQGRVEVYHNGEWGAVCSNSFTLKEADVVCRLLDFRQALKVKKPGTFGDADLIILDGVQCEGTERQLEDCKEMTWYPSTQDCRSSDAAAVVCNIDRVPETVKSVKVRLTGGSIEREGQVEVYHNTQWGTICASGFDMNAASVVCRQLGYYMAVYQSSAPKLSNREPPLLLDSVNCRTGLEGNLANCGPLEWNRHDWHNCGSQETAAVVCHGSKIDRDVEFVVRLSNGTLASNGRVEVYHLGKWGSVCGAGLGRNEARAICRQLGHASGEPVKQYGFYGSGEEPVNMWALTCTGDERLIENCTEIEWYDDSKHMCHEEQTAGVVCSDTISKSARTGTPVYAIAILVFLSVIVVLLILTSTYCILLKRSKRNAAATQMRYAVLDEQDNSTAY